MRVYSNRGQNGWHVFERTAEYGGPGIAADATEDVSDEWNLRNTNLLMMAVSTLTKTDDVADLPEDCIDMLFEFQTEQLTAVPVSEENALAYAVCDHFKNGDTERESNQLTNQNWRDRCDSGENEDVERLLPTASVNCFIKMADEFSKEL